MDLNKLKEKLSGIQKKENALRDRFNEELSALKDYEREFVEDYLDNNAKYQPNEKVLKKKDFSRN